MDREHMPSHIAIIMDGNGRWANQRGLPRLAGHNAGMVALKEIVKRCSTLAIPYLTVYAFSTENWKRSDEEVGGIFKILVYYVEKELEELHKNNVKVRILGDTNKLPREAKESLQKAIAKTNDNTGLRFQIALNYGSRDEILRAAKTLALKAVEGSVKVEEIDETLFSQYLFTNDIPDPDLLIRTSGEKRISNFLLWQSAYSEFVFTDVLWPDFTPLCLEEAIMDYQNRHRRYGGVK